MTIANVRGARFALPLLLAAAGCSAEPAAPGAITADEERQLNEAAAMLDDNSMMIDTVNGSGPSEGDMP